MFLRQDNIFAKRKFALNFLKKVKIAVRKLKYKKRELRV